MSVLELFHDGDHECPGCGATITFRTTANGQSVDVLHPQPPCTEFRAFIERLRQVTYPVDSRGLPS